MSEQKFKIQYEKLNENQREAVDTLDGPIMVVAGPGTGKTTILTLRIANILRKTDADPDSILALTFTESGVYSMRKKLVEIIGSDGYRVNIHTFHGFANTIIKRNPDAFPKIIGSRHVGEVEQIEIVEEIISKGNFDKLKPYGDPHYYVRPVLSAIKNLKRENISTNEFEDKISKQEKELGKTADLYHEKGRFEGKMKGKYKKVMKDIEKNKELLLAYEKYQEEIDKKSLYDYEDMLLEVIRAMEENEDLKLSLQENYQYILADEHQDANFSQNKILELLSDYHDSPNLFIVGDEKQAIFRFQGASLENFIYFRDIYLDAKLISLVHNYRSSQTILDGAQAIISNAQGGEVVKRERLISSVDRGEQEIEIYDFSAPSFEKSFIADSIESEISNGVSPRSIAVIYRDNKDAFPIGQALEARGIPFVIESSIDTLADEEILKLIDLLKAINDPIDSEKLLSVMHYNFMGLNTLDTFKLSSKRAQVKKPLHEVLSTAKDIKEADIQEPDKFKDFHKKVLAWAKVFKNTTATRAFEIVSKESGFLEHIMTIDNSQEKLAKLDKLFSELKSLSQGNRGYKMADFIDHLDTLDKYNILITSSEEVILENSVRLMTAHRSKGLEFSIVYIVDATDGHWGNRRNRNLFNLPVEGYGSSKDEDLDDERRLFYVALTRAKDKVFITYSRKDEGGKAKLRSQFVEEIEENFRNEIDTNELEKSLERLKLNVDRKERTKVSMKEKEYLNRLFLEQGLSVTALNNYLDCPWKFFFQNLIRIPRAPNKFQSFGIAIHASLFFYFEKLKDGKEVSVEKVMQHFRDNLSSKILTDEEYEELLDKGEVSLKAYLDSNKSSWSSPLYNELDIAGVKLDLGEGRQIFLKGKLDKVEELEGGDLKVIDYKTGKPKSRNFILGETKSSNGDYKRQLVFYKLLLDRYRKIEAKMIFGQVDFVEPDDKGRLRSETFEVSSDEVAELEDEIKSVSEDILTLDFWNNNCQDKDCEYCRLARSLK